MTDDDLVARIADVLPTPQVSEIVGKWPADERDYFRTGDWMSFSDRREKLDRLRREKAARAVLDVLREAGRLRPENEVVVRYDPPTPRTVFVPFPDPRQRY